MSDYEIEIDDGQPDIVANSLGISEDVEGEIVTFLTSEIDQVLNDQSGLREKLEKWRRQRESEPPQLKKDVPYPNSSNVSVPLAAINAQTMYGHLYSTFASLRPFLKLRPVNKDPLEARKVAMGEKYMNILIDSPSDLDLRNRLRDILYEVGTLGYLPAKVIWLTDRKQYTVTNDAGVTEQVEAITHDGPAIIPIPVENYLYPATASDPQKARWVAHCVEYEEHELRNLEASGVFENVEDIIDFPRSSKTEAQAGSLEREHLEQSTVKKYDVYECYLYWNVDEGSDYWEDIIVHLHKETGTILRMEYNSVGVRTFRSLQFLHRPFSQTGRGTGAMSEHMQDEVDTFHNMRIDNAKVVGQKMLVVKPTVNIRKNEKVYPGKIWRTPNPREDIVGLGLGDVVPSSLQIEMSAVQYSQRATGMSDTMAGFADQTLKSRDTMGGQKVRLQQSQGVFASIVASLEDGFAKLLTYVLYQLVHNKDRVIENERRYGRLSDEEIKLLDEFLSVDKENIPIRFNFVVKTSDVEETFEAKKQNYMMLTQMLSMYYKQVIPLAMQLWSPQAQGMPPDIRNILSHSFGAFTKLMSETLKLYGEYDVEEYVPQRMAEREKLLRDLMTAMQDQMNQMQGGFNGIANGNVPGPGAVQPGRASGPTGGVQANPGMGPVQAGMGVPNNVPPGAAPGGR